MQSALWGHGVGCGVTPEGVGTERQAGVGGWGWGLELHGDAAPVWGDEKVLEVDGMVVTQ